MPRHDTAPAALANEDSRDGSIDGLRRMNAPGEPPSRTDRVHRVSVENRRRIKPDAAGGIKEPSSIVIGSPAPRLIADPGPAKCRIHDPLPIREWRPAKPHTEGSPPVSISSTRGKGAIAIQIGESRNVIRRTRVLQRRGGGGGDAVDAAGDPVIEVVFIRKAADAHGRIVACFQRKGLALFEPRRVLILQNGNAALISFDSSGIVVIIKPESAPAISFHGEVAAGDAEVVAARSIHIEGSGLLPENEARGPRGIVDGQIVER